MAKKVMLAVAGAGKTYYICHKIDFRKKNLIIAYTHENIHNIKKELCDAKLKDTLSYCKEDALKEANQNEKLIETAKSNLQDSITALLTPLLKEAGYKIVW